MTHDEFNSWACEIANDYAQAVQEMGPDDHETWYEYRHRRLEECDEAYAYVQYHAKEKCDSYTPMDSNDLRDLLDPITDCDIEVRHHEGDNDPDDMPF